MSQFYSQAVAKQVIDNLCIKCEAQFDRWVDYHAHVTTANCVRHIKPIRTTSRNKAQIVADWESNNERNIIQ